MHSDRQLRSIDLNPPSAIPTEREPEEEPAVLDPSALLVEQVRQAYIMCYRAFKDDPSYGANGLPAYDGDGGRDRWGRRNPKSVWPQLARQVLSLGADPIAYVHAQFHFASRGRTPTPNMMLGPQGERNYTVSAEKAVVELKQKLESDRTSVNAIVLPLRTGLGWTEERALRHALFNVAVVTSSPLYRLCLGLQRGFDDVVRYFYVRGLIQYAFQLSAYDEAWGELIPPVVRTEGTAMRNRMLA